jgi:hypothetical protein
MAKQLVVFYGTQVFGEFDSWKEYHQYLRSMEDYHEVYNGAYVHVPENKYTRWYRSDKTPVLIEDVPKVLQMLALVLNL